jgi:hypothetical protein
MKREIIYKGKLYPVLDIFVSHESYYPDGEWLIIGKESLRDMLSKDSNGFDEKVNPESVRVDEYIYSYVPDDVFDRGDIKEITEKWLDEKFELAGE